MKVAFYLADQNPHRDRSKGITVYTDALLRELVRESDELQLLGLVSRSSYRPAFDGVQLLQLPFATDRGVPRFLADQFHPWVDRRSMDFWHYPKGYLPVRFSQRYPSIGTVHDVILQHYADRYPEARSRAQYAYWIAVLKSSISRFDMVLTPSEFSRRQIMAFCERHRLRTPPIRVTPEGTEWEYVPESPALKKDVVVHFGSPEPHKGTALLLKYWKLLSETSGHCPRLVVIGTLLDEHQRTLAALKNVEYRPAQPRKSLLECLQSARALIFPSEIEGFGLPAVEAFASFTPVVYVQNTAVEEVLGHGVPGGFELSSFESFRQALETVLELPTAQIRAIREDLSRTYTWRACAETTLAAYREFAR